MPAQPILSWRNIGLFGVCLVTLGITYFFFDEVTNDWYGSNFLNVFATAGMVGIPLTFIGLIGWAKQFGSQKRRQMAAWVFFTPWIVVLSSYLVDGLNIHGSAGLVFLLIFLAIILSVILLLMAAAAKQE